MLRELYVLAILVVFHVQPTKGAENPNGTCYNYKTGNKLASSNCCDRTILENPCNAVDCRVGQICELVYSSTADVSKCADDYSRLKPQCRVQCDSPKSCDEGCYLVKDINGCDVCSCNSAFDNPCVKENACDKSQLCTLLQDRQCFADPCYPSKNCVPVINCPLIQKCPTNCLQYKDSNGCPRCYCCNGCVMTTCPTGQKCVLNQVTCIKCPCLPVAQCV